MNNKGADQTARMCRLVGQIFSRQDPFNKLKTSQLNIQSHTKIESQQCGMCGQQRLRPATAYAQSDQSLCKSLEYSMTVRLLTKQHLELLSLKGGCTGLSESIFVKLAHC